VDGKGAIVAAVREHVWPMIADGRVRPIVHTTMPMSDAAAAHTLFDAGGVIGKVLLTVPAYGGANGDGG
jgi:NADPH:quinone reductase-like Zn-dependent oxidoreductase